MEDGRMVGGTLTTPSRLSTSFHCQVKDHISQTPLQPRVASCDPIPANDKCQGLCEVSIPFDENRLSPCTRSGKWTFIVLNH